MHLQQLSGIIIKGIGGFYYVEAANKVYECKARGIFRKDNITPFPGDYVHITVNEDNENTIDKIEERKNCLSRPTVANIDRLFIISSVCEPKPNTLIIDKMTTIASKNNIEAIIVINKSDLQIADELLKIYSNSGFKTIMTSATNGEGIDELKSELEGYVSAFTGNSGVGKSTILNKIYPNLQLETSDISRKLGRGRHTTRHVELFKINNGYIADTPGFSSLELEKNERILKDELPYCFIEFKQYLNECKFTSCTHTFDKGCKIIEAVEKGLISKSRHDNYIEMYNQVKNIKEWEMKQT